MVSWTILIHPIKQYYEFIISISQNNAINEHPFIQGVYSLIYLIGKNEEQIRSNLPILTVSITPAVLAHLIDHLCTSCCLTKSSK